MLFVCQVPELWSSLTGGISFSWSDHQDPSTGHFHAMREDYFSYSFVSLLSPTSSGYTQWYIQKPIISGFPHTAFSDKVSSKRDQASYLQPYLRITGKKKKKNTCILGRSNRKSKLPHSYPLFCRVLHIKSKLLGTGFADAPKFQGTHSISTQNSVSVPFSHKGMQINFSFEFWPATMRIRKQRIKSYLYPS